MKVGQIIARQAKLQQSLRILQVVTDDDRRGAQVFAGDLEQELSCLGHRVNTVGLSPGVVGGLDVDVLGPRRMHASTLLSLRRLMTTADVVVAHGSTTLPACAVASLGTRVPFVYRQISDSLFWANTLTRRLRVRWALARAARVVALWDGAADTLKQHFGVPSGRIDCIANGVAAERFPFVAANHKPAARRELGLSPSGAVVAYVGALTGEKGVDTAVEALSDLSNVTLLIVGAGPERARLEERAGAYPKRVIFIGSVDQPQTAYAAADVVVLPSRGGDSMPATLIEAGLTGRPVVSTPVAGIPKIVQDNVTGFIVPQDDACALAAAVRKLLGSDRLSIAFSYAARRRCIENYSIKNIAPEWARTIDRATIAV
jgi:glycosyltransferase involved in cell wall biosynthesis